MDNLKKRGWTLVNTCFLCKGEEESWDHILLIVLRLVCYGNWSSPFWSG